MKTKTIHKPLLSGGLFDKPFMDSRATTQTVSTKEWVLGHLIGPLGLIFVVNTIAALVEKFFTQQTGAMYGVDNIAMIMKMGGVYEVVMTVAKILAMGTGLLNGWLIQHTQCRQGRMRPWYLIFGFISIIIGSLIFLFPGKTLGENYWYYFFFLLICYHTVGSSYFYLFRDTICSLTSRSPREKAFIQYIRKMSWTLISGIIIGMLLNMVALPMWLEKDITGYPKLMLILSTIAIPLLLLLEYFYTRERITEDVTLEQSNAYIFATLMCYAFDSIEYKSHLRLEGMMGVAVITAIQWLIYAPFAGGFESGILKLGFVDAVGVAPSAEVIRFMTMSFYLFDIILAAAVVILLPFVDVEKYLPEINTELLDRKKQAVLARGEVWVAPDEQQRLEDEAAERIHEEHRIEDLKARCAKKGLDFDTANAKYLAKQAKKAAKKKK